MYASLAIEAAPSSASTVTVVITCLLRSNENV